MIAKISETQGISHTLSLKDGSTFRIFARETKCLPSESLTDAFNREKGLCIIHEAETEVDVNYLIESVPEELEQVDTPNYPKYEKKSKGGNK